MTNLIQIKRSSTTATPPSLAAGELAWSEVSKTLFIGESGNLVTPAGGAGVFAKKTDALSLTGDASGDFARMMIPHHQSAIDMVDALMAQKDVDPDLKKMAEKMKKEQTNEIGKLQKWLEAHPK